MNKKFYVYALIDPRKRKKGAVFYVGKGTWSQMASQERNQHHLRDSINGTHCNPHLQRKIKKIHEKGLVYGVDFLFSTDNEDECLAKEIFYIALFGRKTLCNLTDGGEGASGWTPSEETRKKISAKAKGRPSRGKGKPLAQETKNKLSATMKGRPGYWLGKHLAPATKVKLSAINKGKSSPMLGKHHSEETKAKMSADRLGKFAGEDSPNFGKKASPVTLARMSASARIVSKEKRANLSAAAKIREAAKRAAKLEAIAA